MHELLTDEERSHHRPEDDHPTDGCDPKDCSTGVDQVVEGVGDTALTHDEESTDNDRHTDQAEGDPGGPRCRDGADPQDEGADHHDRHDPAQVVHGLGGLIDVRRDDGQHEDEGNDGRGHSDEEYAPPPEGFQERSGDHGADDRSTATQPRPQGNRSHARATWSPQCRDEGQRRGIGKSRGNAREDAPADEDFRRRRPRGDRTGRQRQEHAEQEQALAPVPITERPEIEHRHRQAEGASDRHQVELCLTRGERLADIGQGHIGHTEIQIGHNRGQDQSGEDKARTFRSSGCLRCHLRHDLSAPRLLDHIEPWGKPRRGRPYGQSAARQSRRGQQKSRPRMTHQWPCRSRRPAGPAHPPRQRRSPSEGAVAGLREHQWHR